ncbi:MAG: HAD-IIIA family hydrolase [Desulfobacterales bacterium]|nr:HAD-IIIA family hydrolase [Desulfobacterales bacterium]
MSNGNHEFCPPGKGGYPSDCELTEALRQRARERQEPAARRPEWRACLEQARPVKLLLLDVDGVLTNGTITYTDDGNEIKSFHTRDGFGLRILQQGGVEVGLITARSSKAVTRRAEELKLKHVYQKSGNKLEIFEKLLKELSLTPAEVAYMGDDWLDLPLLTRAGFSATVADGVAEVRQRVDYVTENPGGHGAVREVCDLILEARGVHWELLNRYLRKGG